VAPERRAGAPRRHVPGRLVDRADHLRERAGLAALDRHDVRAALEQRAQRVGIRTRSAVEQRREQRGDQARAMLGTAGREVRERLAPSGRTVAGGEPHQHHGTVDERAEGVRDRRGDRRAEQVAFDAGDRRGHGGGSRSCGSGESAVRASRCRAPPHGWNPGVLRP